MKAKAIVYVLLWSALVPLHAQRISNAILEKPWDAHWITTPEHSETEYGVYLFRKTIELNVQPALYVVHVSADNRYQLYVNGTRVSSGPARGDLNHWNFETVDLAPYLRVGSNVLAARVWNEAEWRPEAQFTAMTGFVLQGNTHAEAQVNTGKGWKCMRDESYAPMRQHIPGYYVAGPGEVRDFAKATVGWKGLHFEDTAWPEARILFRALPKDVQGPYGTTNGWMLRPSTLPPMEFTEERLQRVAEANMVLPSGFPTRPVEVTVPPRTSVRILLDQGYLTNAFPVMTFGKGAGATVVAGYAEALYLTGREKGNRNETTNKEFIGRTDSLVLAGRAEERYSPLSYRTYRYVQLLITTKDEPLVLKDMYSVFTGYPFQWNADFRSNSEELSAFLEIGWRTARLCAVDTYMDCPFYEQLQYIGDARIQALISLYNSGDDRLVKNALDYMDYSRRPEGVTLSRHPSYTPQYIPTFSLWYIGMLHDYSRYGKDLEFVRQKLGGVHQILKYFERYQGQDHSLRKVPQWRFTDWVNDPDWVSGEGPMGADGSSAMLDLQLLYAYQTAILLETELGEQLHVEKYRQRVDDLKAAVRRKYWMPEKGLFADREERDRFSQHTNALALLTGVAEGEEVERIVAHLMHNPQLSQASIYFKYYLHRALIQAGQGNKYLSLLDKWRENRAMGLTTWAEMSDVSRSRSDCHAWGSSPNIELFRTVLGIDSDAPGFARVKITPQLNGLPFAAGHIPHPQGRVAASYRLEKGTWRVEIDLPEGVLGTLLWDTKTFALRPGQNSFTFAQK